MLKPYLILETTSEIENKKVIGLMKGWDNNMFNKYKKVKGTKYCVMKKNLNFKIIKIV